MDGLLLIDKPTGPTSHDAVARIRKTSGERRIGHTGTLDPRASGLLLLVVGRATRLAPFLTSSDKTYDATIVLGVATETDDADGAPIGEPSVNLPASEAIDAALDTFRGASLQLPPRHSAKHIAGERAYDIARRDGAVDLKPVSVTVHELTRRASVAGTVGIRLVVGAGFYVRALARDLGERLGCGAHLGALRRVRSGVFDVEDAISLEDAERMAGAIAGRLIAPGDALPHLPEVRLTDAGTIRVRHGNPVGPEYVLNGRMPATTEALHVRVRTADGELLALASPRGGALHPTIVLS